MTKILKISILIFLIFIGYNLKAKIKWEVISSTPVDIKRVIGGEGLHDFWVIDENKTIYNYFKGEWIPYAISELFPFQNIRTLSPVLVGKNRLFILLTDLNWNTHIVEINNSNVKKYNYISEFPVKGIVKSYETLFAFGDFGLILKLENDKWEKIESPIESHILFSTADKNGNLWLGTNGEGIYTYRNKKFNEYEDSQELKNSIVTAIKCKEDTVFFRTSGNELFKIVNGIISNIEENDSIFADNVRLLKSGYYKITSGNNKYHYIPYNYKIKWYKKLNDGHSLLLTQESKLYYDKDFNGSFFIDFAELSGISGPDYFFKGFEVTSTEIRNDFYNKLIPGIIISDFNNDKFSDILFFNISDKRNPYFYINNKYDYYTNYSDISGLSDLSFSSFFTYSYDLNGDFIPELITSDYENNRHFIKVYERISGIYEQIFSFQIPEEFDIRAIQNLSCIDIDSDGDLDLSLLFGYSKGGKGSIFNLINNGYANFNVVDSTNIDVFEGWNVNCVYADLNNDGLDDNFVTNNWGPNVIFFKKSDGNWQKTELIENENDKIQRKNEIAVFDFDNDGDLDIFSLAENPFITALENDGNGIFSNVTDQIGLGNLNNGKKSGSINKGDFNNDGFIDIFISYFDQGRYSNFIFLNDTSRGFYDYSDELGISNGEIEFASIGDMDRDGDLDIYGFKKGNNVYWKNNLDNNNFLQIKLEGVKSNSEGLGSKIWVYESGKLANNDFLVGYRQVGSLQKGLNFQNENLSHFGLDASKSFDILIKFKAGKTKIIKEVYPGKLIVVREISAPLSWYYLIDNYVRVILKDNEILSYFFVIIIGLIALLYSVYIGYRKFEWNFYIIVSIVIINITVFVTLLTILSFSDLNFKYYIPLAAIILGSLGPLGFFILFKKFGFLKTHKQRKYELFQLLLNFTHGEWGASNLNSLQLFFENFTVDDINNPEFKFSFEKRNKTFIEFTVPVLDKIISLSEKFKGKNEFSNDIKKHKDIIVRGMKGVGNGEYLKNQYQISTSIIRLRELLIKIKEMVFSSHSCDPLKIAQNLHTELSNVLKKESVDFKIINFLTDDEKVLIGGVELTNILDNCIQNSIKAMKGCNKKSLDIKLIKGDPRIYIEVIDNGIGISKEKFEDIFNNGYSTFNSSGYGLYYSKNTVSKYGGRISVKKSIPFNRTVIEIELQKGYNYEEVDFIN